MKNFDIEKLERKNIYKTPENFFAEMQANVLKEAALKPNLEKTIMPLAKSAPIKTNWAYAVAAALALLLGLGFFIKNMNATTDQPAAITFAENNIAAAKSSQTLSQPIEDSQTVKTEISSKGDLTFVEYNNQNTKAVMNVEPAKEVRTMARVEPKLGKTTVKAVKINNKESVDQILTSFTSSELAEMSKDEVMDVYLDLYN